MNWKNSPPPSATHFEEANIRIGWSELHTRFGFPLEPWKKRLDDYRKRSNIKDPVEAFYQFGNVVINPVLNEILCRKSGYPTFLRLVEYVGKR